MSVNGMENLSIAALLDHGTLDFPALASCKFMKYLYLSNK